MRHAIFILCFTCSAFYLSAQQLTAKEYNKHVKKIEQSKGDKTVIVSLDTVYNKGIPWAILKKAAATDQDYSVKDMSGNEVIYCRFNSYDNAEHTGNIGSVEKRYYYQFIFKASKKQFETENKTVQQLAEFIVQSGLLINGQINDIRVTELADQYGNKYSAGRNTPVEVFTGHDSGKKYTMVDRDRKKLIVIRENSIEQDNKKIGILKSEIKPEGVITYYVFTIMLPDKTTIAEAKYQSYGTNDIEIHTESDDTIIRVVKPDYDIDKAIVQYLIDNQYL